MNIALRRFLHNHGNIATEGSPKPGLCPTLISNDFKVSLLVWNEVRLCRLDYTGAQGQFKIISSSNHTHFFHISHIFVRSWQSIKHMNVTHSATCCSISAEHSHHDTPMYMLELVTDILGSQGGGRNLM